MNGFHLLRDKRSYLVQKVPSVLAVGALAEAGDHFPGEDEWGVTAVRAFCVVAAGLVWNAVAGAGAQAWLVALGVVAQTAGCTGKVAAAVRVNSAI